VKILGLSENFTHRYGSLLFFVMSQCISEFSSQNTSIYFLKCNTMALKDLSCNCLHLDDLRRQVE
jgi:hypothetical protein